MVFSFLLLGLCLYFQFVFNELLLPLESMRLTDIAVQDSALVALHAWIVGRDFSLQRITAHVG